MKTKEELLTKFKSLAKEYNILDFEQFEESLELLDIKNFLESKKIEFFENDNNFSYVLDFYNFEKEFDLDNKHFLEIFIEEAKNTLQNFNEIKELALKNGFKEEEEEEEEAKHDFYKDYLKVLENLQAYLLA